MIKENSKKAPRFTKLRIVLALFFTFFVYLHIQHYLSFYFGLTWKFIISGQYKGFVDLGNVYLRLFVLFCFWFTIAILAYSTFWLFRLLYTDIYNFFVIKVLYKNEDGNIEDLVKREIKFLSRMSIHFLVILPFVLLFVLIYYSFFILESLWLAFLRSDSFDADLGLLGYKIKYQIIIFYSAVFLYWYLVFYLAIFVLRKIRKFFATEEIAEEHGLSI